MRRVARWLALASGLTAFGQTPVVSDLDTISVHVKGVDPYNAAFRLLTEEFGWPIIYGRLLTPEEGAKRNYAGIWAGNVMLEICGPFAEEFAPNDRPMRLHGLTFQPRESAEASAAELKGREIRFRGPVSWGSGHKFVFLEDPALVRQRISVSIMEVRDLQARRAEREKAGKALKASGGGALGLQSVVEAVVTYRDAAALGIWRSFLGDGWNGGEGPRLRLVKGPGNSTESIVLRGQRRSRATELLLRAESMGIRMSLAD